MNARWMSRSRTFDPPASTAAAASARPGVGALAAVAVVGVGVPLQAAARRPDARDRRHRGIGTGGAATGADGVEAGTGVGGGGTAGSDLLVGSMPASQPPLSSRCVYISLKRRQHSGFFFRCFSGANSVLFSVPTSLSPSPCMLARSAITGGDALQRRSARGCSPTTAAPWPAPVPPAAPGSPSQTASARPSAAEQSPCEDCYWLCLCCAYLGGGEKKSGTISLIEFQHVRGEPSGTWKEKLPLSCSMMEPLQAVNLCTHLNDCLVDLRTLSIHDRGVLN